MELNDLIERDTEEIIQMLDEHGVKVVKSDTLTSRGVGFIVSSEDGGDFVADELELCLVLWGVVAGKKRAASMI